MGRQSHIIVEKWDVGKKCEPRLLTSMYSMQYATKDWQDIHVLQYYTTKQPSCRVFFNSQWSVENTRLATSTSHYQIN